MSPYCDLDLEVNTPIFLQGTAAHDDTPPCKVWLQKAGHFRRYCLVKIQTQGQIDTVIPIYPHPHPNFIGGVWGGGGEEYRKIEVAHKHSMLMHASTLAYTHKLADTHTQN